MRPLAFLQCVAKAALHAGGNLVGFGMGDIVEKVWNEWNKEKNEEERKAELQALVQMVGDEFHHQVKAVVREVAGGQPAATQESLSLKLQLLPDLICKSFSRPEDPEGRSIPPGFHLGRARDLAPLLEVPRTETETGPPPLAAPRVTLEFTAGHLEGQSMVYETPTVLLFGRAVGCNPRCPEDGFRSVSRGHCLLELNPPDVRIRDLGSKSGTFVNGNLIGKRPEGADPNPDYASPEHDLGDGSEVHLTRSKLVAFRVHVSVPAYCAICEAVIPGAENRSRRLEAGVLVCSHCRKNDRGAAPPVKTCKWCGKGVAAERGANRPGMFVCGDCRGNVNLLAGQAQAGAEELLADCGYTIREELGRGGMGSIGPSTSVPVNPSPSR
jgi:hypothetical protein